jgi:phospholipid transport system substrate-binding protein
MKSYTIKSMRLSVVLLMSCVVGAISASASPAPEGPDSVALTPTAFLMGHDTAVRDIVLREPADNLTTEEREQVRLLINQAFDFRELARLSLGPAWDLRSPAEQDEFVGVYQKIIERRNLDMFVSYHRDGGISYTGEEIDAEGRATVLTEVPLKKEKKVIAYSLFRTEAQPDWRIYDLTVDGASTVAGNRRTWTRYIARKSYEQLLEGLRKKLANLEGAG